MGFLVTAICDVCGEKSTAPYGWVYENHFDMNYSLLSLKSFATIPTWTFRDGCLRCPKCKDREIKELDDENNNS